MFGVGAGRLEGAGEGLSVSQVHVLSYGEDASLVVEMGNWSHLEAAGSRSQSCFSDSLETHDRGARGDKIPA
jgi:hypothetical protein